MKRRDFLKLTGLLSAGATLPFYPSMRLFAATDNYTGPLWIMIDARGGWDPTSLCDPKGYSSPTDPARVNNYSKDAIATIGKIKYAPPPDSFGLQQANYDPTLYTADTFFTKYYSQLLIVNGIDTKTNSHSDGARHCWSGELARKGFPSIGALIAGLLAPSRSMSYIANGGYTYTADLIVPIGMDYRGVNALYEIAYPNRTSPKSTSSRLYFPEGTSQTMELIKTAFSARQQRLAAQQNLQKIKTSINKFITSKQDSTGLKYLADNLSGTPSDGSTAPPENTTLTRSSAKSIYQQGRIALAAYQSGVTAAAHISLGGFDTHSNHDANHYPRLMDLLQGIDAIIDEASARNLSDQIVVMVASDFGRTPKYNGNNGKDHWPVTSMMFIGNSTQKIEGNRVVGATTDAFKAMNVINDSNGNFTAVPSGTTGSIHLTPAHIHRCMRRLAGIDTTNTALSLALQDGDLVYDIFTRAKLPVLL